MAEGRGRLSNFGKIPQNKKIRQSAIDNVSLSATSKMNHSLKTRASDRDVKTIA